MLMPTSSEFVALCRAQVSLLTQGLGATLGVVYLTQQLVDGVEDAETHLVPIVVYPESAADWAQQDQFLLPRPEVTPVESMPRLLADARSSASALEASVLEPVADIPSHSVPPESNAGTLVPQRQIVLPLIHDNVVLGLLVVGRDDRGWSAWEQGQIEQIANTIALACVLDQRYQWLAHERQQDRLLQAQQHDRLDNLLHQFRNSLTALQTFGKLILKRLLPGDTNRSIADSIVRESSRLKELAQQLEAATATTAAAEVPLFLPPAISPQVSPTTPPAAVGLLAGASLPLSACSVAVVLEPLLASAQAIAQDHNLTLQAAIPEHVPPVQANAQALREVLNNLIENALKYTPAGGQVWVEVEFQPVQPAWVEIAVSDTGPGIPPQDLPHVFERRYRGIQANTGIPGSGLGLAIAKTLVEQMQGEIQIFSPAQTRLLSNRTSADGAANHAGTTLVVRLPVVGSGNH